MFCTYHLSLHYILTMFISLGEPLFSYDTYQLHSNTYSHFDAFNRQTRPLFFIFFFEKKKDLFSNYLTMGPTTPSSLDTKPRPPCLRSCRRLLFWHSTTYVTVNVISHARYPTSLVTFDSSFSIRFKKI